MVILCETPCLGQGYLGVTGSMYRSKRVNIHTNLSNRMDKPRTTDPRALDTGAWRSFHTKWPSDPYFYMLLSHITTFTQIMCIVFRVYQTSMLLWKIHYYFINQRQPLIFIQNRQMYGSRWFLRKIAWAKNNYEDCSISFLSFFSSSFLKELTVRFCEEILSATNYLVQLWSKATSTKFTGNMSLQRLYIWLNRKKLVGKLERRHLSFTSLFNAASQTISWQTGQSMEQVARPWTWWQPKYNFQDQMQMYWAKRKHTVSWM